MSQSNESITCQQPLVGSPSMVSQTGYFIIQDLNAGAPGQAYIGLFMYCTLMQSQKHTGSEVNKCVPEVTVETTVS